MSNAPLESDSSPPHQGDAFLSSMTFASGQVDRGCDCDECDMIPADVRAAIRQHKRQKILTEPMVRTQDRVLVKREESVSVWKWTMPLNAEPLIEFGNSHRIIFVQQLAKNSEIMSVGKGIIGSSTETSSRFKVSWTEGKAYFVRSNGGKALGWIHENRSDSNAEDETSRHTIIYNIKVPLSDEKIREALADEEASFDSEWVIDLFKLFAGSVQPAATSKDTEPADKGEELPVYGVEMSKEDSTKVSQIIKLLEGAV